MNNIGTIFLDRDGVINKKAPEGDYVKNSQEVFILAGALEAIAQLNAKKFLVIEITNQRGIGKGIMNVSDFNSVTKKIDKEMKKVNAHIDAIYYCSDTDKKSINRKPNIGMIKKAMLDYPEISLDNSWMIGDSESDQKCALNAGIRYIMIGKIKTKMQKENQEFSVNSLADAISIINKQNG